MQTIHSVADLGLAIRVERKAQGLTQTQLADLSGSGLTFISNLERGKTTSEIGKVLTVMNTLGLDMACMKRGQ
ncbi:helix-turn-helix domain-containing protein [Curtanaerobium respiraculi]|uniref:helix-turn-helix domain-containing protein n=1 Tax=Curtanaerobium respiraculi TaxID=2949669 RepID=UPI0024B37A16|nr:helix-turn-helix domain-containing protein [Curtanaerobium respiraculi]